MFISRQSIKWLLQDDHHPYARFFRISGPIWGLFYLLFYLLLNYVVGFQESLTLRVISALLLGSFYFVVPAKDKLSSWQQWYIDFVLCLSAPVLFSYHLIINQSNEYWFSSMVFAALCYGLLARAPWSLLFFPLLSFGTIYFYKVEGEYLRKATLCLIVSTTMLFLSVTMRIFLRYFVQQISFLRFEQKKTEQIRENFIKLQERETTIRTFVRPSLLSEIALGLDPLKYKERIVKKAIMFTDIQGFTAMAERNPTHEVFEILNEYFSIINKAVFDCEGEVDKFMGDAAMAIFENPEMCLKACLTIQETMDMIQRERREAGRQCYKFGIGISYGSIMSGNFGSYLKLDRTVIGDAVNVAARIESLTRVYGVSVIASEDFIATLPGRYPYARPIAETAIRGRKELLRIYEIFASDSFEIRQKKMATIEVLENLMNHQQENSIAWRASWEKAIHVLGGDNGDEHNFNILDKIS
ncbi:MAG: adenylate/guanylate cyclase domain-containing protein [Proteobacteria bacterium]|nr:adenylate/guanylate cyclase domain-containing protein [Pseudomonadota bacterium]